MRDRSAKLLDLDHSQAGEVSLDSLAQDLWIVAVQRAETKRIRHLDFVNLYPNHPLALFQARPVAALAFCWRHVRNRFSYALAKGLTRTVSALALARKAARPPGGQGYRI